MKIPNQFLTLFGRTELMVACRMYAIVNAHTPVSKNGYEITIKQQTVASSCGLSVSTVKRTIRALESKGIITHKYRKGGSQGNLGAYRYSLKPFSFLSDYFYLDNRVFSAQLTPKEFYVYALFSKLKRSATLSFYQSLNDLYQLTKLKRSEIVSIIDSLIAKHLVMRQRKKTKTGDYTDNTYFVIIYVRNSKFRQQKKRACGNRLSHSKANELWGSQIHNHIQDGNSITHYSELVKWFLEKKRKKSHISLDGGGG